MANLIPPVPLLGDIQNLPLLQLQAYCLVYELPTINAKMADMRDNLRRVRLIMQGDAARLDDNDRRTLFNAWGLPGDYSTAPTDAIAVILVGYAIGLAMRYNALGYCRTTLTITADNPTTGSTGTGNCAITLEVEAASDAGLPLTGTGQCNIALTVSSIK